MSGSRIVTTIIILSYLILGSFRLSAQSDSTSRGYPPIDENLIIESKWLYTYTAHSPSNSIIHKADESYEYYLYLKFDNTYEHYLNGNISNGGWLLNETKNELYYSFRQIRWWKIAELKKETLVLEFEVDGVPYQYHFVRVVTDNAPFRKAKNELPDIEVNAEITTEQLVEAARDQLTAKQRKQEEKKEKRRAREEKRDERINSLAVKPTTIEIAVTGGGYYGGPDPVIKDFTVIKSDGRLVKEFESISRGLIKTKKDIGREETEKLAEFITSKGFFDYKNLYDCQTVDCNKRKTAKPTPIPLRISFTYGNRRKVVTVSIWGLDDKKIQYVNYPPDLDVIIEGIQRLASGI